MKKVKGKKLGNKGMSLVEVLVAMIIISVAGITFLQSFDYSVKNNAKAREKQHALVLAQSMMETFKAYSLEELDNSVVANNAFTVYSLGSPAIYTPSGGVHTYGLLNVDFNGYKYDVKMKAEPSTTKSTRGSIASVHNPSEKDAQYVHNFEGEQEQIAQTVWNALLATEGTYPGIENYLKNGYSEAAFFDKTLFSLDSRTINVIVYNDGSNRKIKTTVSYTCTVKPFTYIDKDGVSKTYPEYTGIMGSYDVLSTDAYADLKSVYVYYYPAYQPDPSGTVSDRWIACNSDNIMITNNTSVDVDAYVVKQELPNMVTTSLTSFEAMYKPTIKKGGSGKVDLYHNLTVDLFDKTHNTTYTNGGGFNKIVDALFEKETEELVYNVTVEVCKHGLSDVIYTLNGTTNYR